MFDPITFKDFIRIQYCTPKTKNTLFSLPSGSKDLTDLGPWDSSVFEDLAWPHRQALILHDEEPLLPEMFYNFKTNWQACHPLSPQALRLNRQEIGHFIPADHWLSWQMPLAAPPILAHSQRNCAVIRLLESQGWLTVHYWYHAIVSRHWFAKYQWYKDLRPTLSKLPCRMMFYARGLDGTRSYRRDLISALTAYTDVLYINEAVSGDASATIDVTHKQHAHMQIVMETLFDQNFVHLTEKVFKPIVMSQPFVLFAPAGSLAYLRSYGFRTFSALWDESYDLETDHVRRRSKVLELIDQLLGLSDSAWQSMLQQCETILVHNRTLFFGDAFANQLVHELDTNMTHAVRRQQQIFQRSPGQILFHCLRQAIMQGLRPDLTNALIADRIQTLAIADPSLANKMLDASKML